MLDDFPSQLAHRMGMCIDGTVSCYYSSRKDYFQSRASFRSLLNFVTELDEIPERKVLFFFHQNNAIFPGRLYSVGSPAEELAVYVSGSQVFLSDGGPETAVRLAPAERLRLSGLVWPEARERLAESSWLTRERLGDGQVLLFASVPVFRGQLAATGRLLGNAVVLGPGLGADAPLAW